MGARPNPRKRGVVTIAGKPSRDLPPIGDRRLWSPQAMLDDVHLWLAGHLLACFGVTALIGGVLVYAVAEWYVAVVVGAVAGAVNAYLHRHTGHLLEGIERRRRT